MLIGLAAGVFTGVLLGLLGSGGSIVALPIYAYVLAVPTKPAIAMSLGSVGLTALGSALDHWRRGNLDIRVALTFSVFASVGAFLGAKLGLITPDIVQLLVFAGFMYVAAWRMLRRSDTVTARPDEKSSVEIRGWASLLRMGTVAFGVGVLTGVVGIGGGFMIIPALVLVVGLPMKLAVGTSLLVIFIKSAAGFAGYVGSVPINYALMGEFTVIAIAGGFFGVAVAKRMSSERLKRVFGWFVIVVATFIIYKELPHVWH